MAGDVARIERKLQSLITERHCDLCARRAEACPSCGRPVGQLPGFGEDARRRLLAEIDRVAARRGELAAMFDAHEG